MYIDLILAVCFFIFFLRIAVSYIGAVKERRKKVFKDLPEVPYFLSVVVPGRNEEANFKECILSIAQSNYPSDRFEIIAVNDRSEDSTGQILDDLKSQIPNLSVIHIDDTTKVPNLRGKPGALQAGIERAKGEIIVMTDADCTVNPNWLSTLAKTFQDEQIGMSAGYSAIKTKTIFDKIQAVEWTYLHTLATTGVGFDIPLSCYGNNLAVRKKDFDAIGGYHSVSFSVTEDLALMHAIHKSGKKIRYLTLEESTITTQPCPNFKEYLKQKHRWVIGALDLGWIAFVFVLTSFSMWLGIAISLFICHPWWLLAFILLRFAGDSLITIPSARILKQNKIIKWTIPAIFFFIFMELVAPFLLLKKDVKWKGQTF
ncbi:glycosyltransferase [Bacteroidetes/Chlorobi group bacterium ChocPot_Mid]|jgi:cellulose synthase/poly-beta-1,6-N-acetylglucosamine synthase-like glycosyltransferase|nr:MAG: glycosyltransferase [Bacteroidetes/Chlorobi group bacterium ChocPot_Mid]